MKRGKGQIATWLDDKGYGFIRPVGEGKELFLHVKEVATHQRRPRAGDWVTFDITGSETDKPAAVRASICGFSWSFFTVLCVLLIPVLGVYGYAVWQDWAPLYPALLVYVVMSLITIFIYHRDKAMAQTGGWRISERKLHVLEVLGGWPGALLAQIYFRHKLKKFSYQLVFWLIVVAHGCGWSAVHLCAACSPELSEPLSKMASSLASLPKLDFPLARNSAPLPSPEPDPAAAAAIPPAPALLSSQPVPASVEEAWALDAPSEPPLDEPGSRRSSVNTHKRSRMSHGVVKAISLSRGLLIEMPPEIGGRGIIPPSALVPDFHRRFRPGEPITVAVRGVTMKGKQSTLDLLLVDQETASSKRKPL